MKTITNTSPLTASRKGRFTRIKALAACVLILSGAHAPIAAQKSAGASPSPTIAAKPDSITPPSWWFGVAGGANLNYYDGTTQKLNSDLLVPTPFDKGNGIGLDIAPTGQ